MNAIHDTLRLAQRWQEAGVPKAQAEKMVAALNEEIEQGIATKQTVADLRTDMAQDFRNVRNELAIAVRDLKIWTGSVAGILFAALAAIRYFG